MNELRKYQKKKWNKQKRESERLNEKKVGKRVKQPPHRKEGNTKQAQVHRFDK